MICAAARIGSIGTDMMAPSRTRRSAFASLARYMAAN
jgi:hypothetical protein